MSQGQGLSLGKKGAQLQAGRNHGGLCCIPLSSSAFTLSDICHFRGAHVIVEQLASVSNKFLCRLTSLQTRDSQRPNVVFVEKCVFSFRVSRCLRRIVLLMLQECEANCWSELSACHTETSQSHPATSSDQHLTVQPITGAVVTLARGATHSSSPNLHPALSSLKATPPCTLLNQVLDAGEMSQASIPHHTVFQEGSASLENKWTDKAGPSIRRSSSSWSKKKKLM